jgi:hypothetical protein
VLEHGFLDIVRRATQLGRMLGHEDYYAWRVRGGGAHAEGRALRALDDLAARTEARTREELAPSRGATATTPSTLELPLPPRGQAGRGARPLLRLRPRAAPLGQVVHGPGGEAFAAPRSRSTSSTAPGKYENGFMHGPGVAFFDHGTWRPARINFTANAVPGAVGSGPARDRDPLPRGRPRGALRNIESDAPCFAQEFAPTSWPTPRRSRCSWTRSSTTPTGARYLTDGEGRPIPQELMEEAIAESQPMRAWDVRAMLTIPMAERAALRAPRRPRCGPRWCCRCSARSSGEMQGLSAGVRPVLAVPHLLAGEASAYYHGYVMAEMAVHQTRALLPRARRAPRRQPPHRPRPRGELLAPGNAATFDDTLRALTGSALSPTPSWPT